MMMSFSEPTPSNDVDDYDDRYFRDIMDGAGGPPGGASAAATEGRRPGGGGPRDHQPAGVSTHAVYVQVTLLND